MPTSDQCELLHPPVVQIRGSFCTLVWASRSAGDRVPLILASYQRPACSPPALEQFGSIPPKCRRRQFGHVTPEVAFGQPRLGTVVKQRRQRAGWAPGKPQCPTPRSWSRANGALPPCFSHDTFANPLVVEHFPRQARLPRACHLPRPLHATTWRP